MPALQAFGQDRRQDDLLHTVPALPCGQLSLEPGTLNQTLARKPSVGAEGDGRPNTSNEMGESGTLSPEEVVAEMRSNASLCASFAAAVLVSTRSKGHSFRPGPT